MSPREQAVLDALRKDRDESGPGLSPERVEVLGRTRYPDSLIARLRRRGYLIGVVGDLYQLGEEPASLSSGDQACPSEAGLPGLDRTQTGDSASVSAVQPLFELPPLSAVDPLADAA